MDLAQRFVHVLALHAHILLGAVERNFPIVHQQIGPLLGDAFDNQTIPAGVFQLGAPDAAGIGTGDHARQGRLGTDHVAARGRRRCAGHGAGDVHQFVAGTQGVHGGNALIVEDFGTQTAAADVPLGFFQLQGFHGHRTGGQIDAGEFLIVRTAHTIPSLNNRFPYTLPDFIIAGIPEITIKTQEISRDACQHCVKWVILVSTAM